MTRRIVHYFSLRPLAVLFLALVALPAAVADGEPDGVPVTSLDRVVDEEGDGQSYPVLRYKTGDVLKVQQVHPSTGTDDGVPPPHMQYIFFMDQFGLMAEGTGLPGGFPEATMVMGSGEFTISSDWWSWFWGTSKKLQVNTCKSETWSWFWDDVMEIDGKRVIGGENPGTTGKKAFLPGRRAGIENCLAELYWNDDFTSAWWTLPREFGASNAILQAILFQGFVLRVGIDLEPYWKWKFGLLKPGWLTMSDADFRELDGQCCPKPPTIQQSGDSPCWGPDAFGKGPICQTISTGCGTVLEEDVASCAMWKRTNGLLFGLIPLLNLPFFGGWDFFSEYLVYPIGDAERRETGFFQRYVQELTSNGVLELFGAAANNE